eukprot:761551-Hanusia_phi.AAC.3
MAFSVLDSVRASVVFLLLCDHAHSIALWFHQSQKMSTYRGLSGSFSSSDRSSSGMPCQKYQYPRPHSFLLLTKSTHGVGVCVVGL